MSSQIWTSDITLLGAIIVSSRFEPVRNMLGWSAYGANFAVPEMLKIPLIFIISSNYPRILTWGTPFLIGAAYDGINYI